MTDCVKPSQFFTIASTYDINWNSTIAPNKLKLSNGSKKLPKLHMKQSMFSIAYTKKFWSQTPILPSLWLKILPNSSQRYDSSSKILRFVNIVRDRLCETFSIFYHGLHVWYHVILTNLMIFRLCLLFLEFKNHSTTRSWLCFLNKMFEISFHFLGKASKWTR